MELNNVEGEWKKGGDFPVKNIHLQQQQIHLLRGLFCSLFNNLEKKYFNVTTSTKFHTVVNYTKTFN